eukprot:6475318-Amphidinium_carterae.5
MPAAVCLHYRIGEEKPRASMCNLSDRAYVLRVYTTTLHPWAQLACNMIEYGVQVYGVRNKITVDFVRSSAL